MMDSIVLNEFGETISLNSATDETILIASYWGNRVRNRDIVGVHDVCNGTIQLRKISTTHNALCCNHCGLRIVTPKEVNTYGRLRQWCAEQIKLKEDERARLEMLWRPDLSQWSI